MTGNLGIPQPQWTVRILNRRLDVGQAISSRVVDIDCEAGSFGTLTSKTVSWTGSGSAVGMRLTPPQHGECKGY